MGIVVQVDDRDAQTVYVEAPLPPFVTPVPVGDLLIFTREPFTLEVPIICRATGRIDTLITRSDRIMATIERHDHLDTVILAESHVETVIFENDRVVKVDERESHIDTVIEKESGQCD